MAQNSSLEFDMNIEEDAQWERKRPSKVPDSATGNLSRVPSTRENVSSEDPEASPLPSPYLPATQQTLLPSPTLPGAKVGRDGGNAPLEASPTLLPAMQGALFEIVDVKHLETNDELEGDVESDPLGCMYEWIDKNQDVFIRRLSDLCAIPGVSALPKSRPFVIQTVGWVRRWCEILGGKTDLKDIGTEVGRKEGEGEKEKERQEDTMRVGRAFPSPFQTVEGSAGPYDIPLPPVLLSTFGDNDPCKKTLCVYGHLDVQPAEKEDGWDTDPFKLTEFEGRRGERGEGARREERGEEEGWIEKRERDGRVFFSGKLFARGATDDKGPVLCWLWVVEFHRKFGLPLPVNLKCIFEGMEESGSVGFEECLMTLKDSWLSDVDGVCVSDNYWAGVSKPCVTYGLRGVLYFSVEVCGGQKDLHSGAHGGAVLEPMNDLLQLLASLKDSEGNLLVEGLEEEVLPLTEEERRRYESIDFNLASYGAHDVGGMKLAVKEEAALLMKRWRFPSLSVHGIEGAFSGAGCKTVIPRRVIGKFSIRTVPNMTIPHVEKTVKEHLKKISAQKNLRNTFKVKTLHAGEAWLGDINSDNFKAAIRASEKVHGVSPDLTREGGSIPIVVSFAKAISDRECPVVLLPIGAADDGAHSQNEKIGRWHLIQGAKTLGTYVREFA